MKLIFESLSTATKHGKFIVKNFDFIDSVRICFSPDDESFHVFSSASFDNIPVNFQVYREIKSNHRM